MTKRLSRFDTPALSSVDSDRLPPIALSRSLERNRQAQLAGLTPPTPPNEAGPVLVRLLLDRLPSRVIARRRAHAAARPMVCCALLMVVMLLAWPGEAAGQTAGAIAIRSISTSAGGANGSTVVVTIGGTGTLPLPTSGAADEPPRIFFDFPGVTLKAPAVTASTDPRIRRIRSAVNSVRPLVTRVVLDLVALQPYRLESGPGGVRVIVGEAGNVLARGIPPVPSLPEPARSAPVQAPREPVRSQPAAAVPAVTNVARVATAPPAAAAVPPPPKPPAADAVARTSPPAAEPAPMNTPAPAPPPPTPAPPTVPTRTAPPPSPSPSPPLPPGRDLERYRRQISPALDRLRLQEPLLTSLDIAEDQTVDRVQLAVEEFERLKQELAGIKPPDSLRPQHDMLLQSTILALMATRLRLEGFRTLDPATLRNAASAAAGATLLLDRVCAELGCPDSGR